MPAVARSAFRDRIITGHTCSATAAIQGALNIFVDINGFPVSVVGDPIAPHTIRVGKYCVPHSAVVNTGSGFVSIEGIPIARIGDSADLGCVKSGSMFVWSN